MGRHVLLVFIATYCAHKKHATITRIYESCFLFVLTRRGNRIQQLAFFLSTLVPFKRLSQLAKVEQKVILASVVEETLISLEALHLVSRSEGLFLGR